MGEQSALLTLKIDTDEPVELRDFVGAFTSLANECERYVDTNDDNVKTDPKMYVREVRSGCIEADLSRHHSAKTQTLPSICGRKHPRPCDCAAYFRARDWISGKIEQ